MATFGFEKIRPSPQILKNAVPEALADVIRALSPNFTEKMWLVGGTALAAYYFGHRRSDDLELFVADARSLDIAVLSLLQNGLTLTDETHTPLYYHAAAEYQGHPFTIDCVVDEHVHRLGNATQVTEGIHVANLDTLFAMKAATLVSRASEKDLFDLDLLLGHLKEWDVALLIDAGKTMDAGLDSETLLISLKGALLRKEACGFLLPDSALTIEQVFKKVTALRDGIVDQLMDYIRRQALSPMVQTLKSSVKDLK